MRDVVKICLLRLKEVRKKSARCRHTAREFAETESLHGLYMKMVLQEPLTRLVVKILLVHRLDQDVQTVPEIVKVKAGHQCGLVADHLRRRDFADLIHQVLNRLLLGHEEFSCRDIGGRDAEPVVRKDQRHQKVVPRLIHGRRIQVGARRDNTGDLPLHKPFGCLRVFDLVADGDLVAELDEPSDIRVHSVKRNAAHRRAFLHPAVLACQRQLQLLGDRDRVVKEHFKKISDAVHENTVAVFLLPFHVLLHHG